MSVQSAQFALQTAFLGLPTTILYGVGRGTGNQVLQHEDASKNRYAVFLHGEGPWNGPTKAFVNRKVFDHTNTAIYHFHSGEESALGVGMTPSSNGPDQNVDNFFSSLPGGLDKVTFSGYPHSFLKVAPDPGAPNAELEFWADFEGMKCRIFDNTGAQTSFAFTENRAWWICDALVRKFVLRDDGRANMPLVAAERARFDWPSFVDSAAYFAAALGAGQARFAKGGLVFTRQELDFGAALEQMLVTCRAYLLEVAGKFTLYADQPRASVFTFNRDNTTGFAPDKSMLRTAKNQILPMFHDVNAATGDPGNGETKFTPGSNEPLNHHAHQRAIGSRGPGLAAIPATEKMSLDLGNMTPEMAWRIASHHLLRQLGDDTGPGERYLAPWRASWNGMEDSKAVLPGDRVTVDKGVEGAGEEFGGKDFEVLTVKAKGDGSREYTGFEYMPNAFPDVAPTQQAVQTPTPGTGLPAGDGNPGASGIIFTETFETAIDLRYHLRLGSFANITYPANGQAGGKVLRIPAGLLASANQVWAAWRGDPIPFDEDALYSIMARYRKLSGANGSLIYVGVEGYLADRVTPCNVSGAATFSSQHYNCVSGENTAPGTGFTVKRSFFKGWHTAGETGTFTANVPGRLHQNVRYIAPLFIIGHQPVSGNTDEWEIDTIQVRPLPRDGTQLVRGGVTLQTALQHVTDAGLLDNADSVLADGSVYARIRGTVMSDGRVRNLRTSGGADLDVDDSAKRAFDRILSTGEYQAEKYSESAYRRPFTTSRNGNTGDTGGAFVTTATFTVVVPTGSSQFKGTATVAKVAGATVSGGVRIKIGANTSNEISMAHPSTQESGTVTITGLSPGTHTVEVEGRTTAGTSGPSVNAAFDHAEYQDAQKGHFV